MLTEKIEIVPNWVSQWVAMETTFLRTKNDKVYQYHHKDHVLNTIIVELNKI